MNHKKPYKDAEEAARSKAGRQPGAVININCPCGKVHIDRPREVAVPEQRAPVNLPSTSRAGLAPVSTKRKAQNRERRAMVAGMFPERPLCVVYVLFQHSPDAIPAEVIGRCGRWADDVHEPLTRARGGSITDPGNAVAPCRSCHDALGKEPEWGYAANLIAHSWDAPKGNVA